MQLTDRARRALAVLTVAPMAVTSFVATTGSTTAFAADPGPIIAGSFQQALGCAADWDPTCTNTQLADPDGDGVFAATFKVPAGNQIFKFTFGGTWAGAKGFNGGGDDNGALTLAADTEFVFAYDSATKRVGVSLPEGALTASGTDVAGDADVAQPAVRQTDEQNFYFVLTDRFANGDTSNDEGGLTGDRLTTGYDPTDKGFYHGGDIQGIVDQLDYIQGLGTTAIWLTPSFQNNPVQGTGENASAGYHGYWVTDFTKIDSHLGGNEAMTALIDAAHAKGMKVYFDIIANHTADGISYAENQYTYIDTATSPYTDADGNVIDITELATSSDWPTLDADVSFPYTPVANPDVNKTPEWLNDVTLYHNRGDSTYSGESDTMGDFSGLDDLMTEHPTVVQGMIDIYKSWIDMGIDGYRIDTAKHVNMPFWQQWTAAIDDYAATENPDFFTFGEVYSADAKVTSPYVRTTGMDSTLDFSFQAAAQNFALGYNTSGLSTMFASDDYYSTGDTSAASLPTFLGNHDMGRLGYFLRSSDQQVQRSEVAHELMYLTRGQPVVYYGDEQGFAGLGGDKDAREDMFATKVDQYATEKLIDGTVAGSQDRYDTTSDLYTTIAKVAALRTGNDALKSGAQIELLATDGAGIYSFARVDRDEKIEYLVAVNNATTAQTADVTTLTPAATYAPLYGTATSLTADADGKVSVTVPALSAVVLKADRQVAAGSAVELKLTDGAALTGAAAEVKAKVADNRWAETTFATRTLDSTEWTTAGVAEDDTPRVFADATSYAVGTPLELRAVSVDGAGTVTGDSALVIVGQDLSVEAPAADEVSGPSMVVVAGSLQDELGCAADWMPACETTALKLDAASGLWVGDFEVPAGTYEWKTAYNGNWDENYGSGGTAGGSNIALTSDGSTYRFFHDPVSKLSWAVKPAEMVTLPGNWQKALGCSEDWVPDQYCTAMIPQGDGTWTFETNKLPAGTYEMKAAVGGGWDANYGVDGVPGGSNYELTTKAGEVVKVIYSETTHALTIQLANPPLAGVGKSYAQWLTADTISFPSTLITDDLSALTWKLNASADGGVTVDEAISGGDSYALTYSGPLGADLVAKYPHLKGYIALTLSDEDAAKAAEIVKGEMVVSASAGDKVKAATAVQLPGVLDDLYAADLADADLGPTWSNGTPTLRLWAPTAQKVQFQRWAADGSGEATVVDAVRGTDGTWTVVGDSSWKDAQYLWLVDVYVGSLDEVTTNAVTDPYSKGLTLNSTRSVLVDLSDDALAPEQWTTAQAPAVLNDSARAIWELHIRDFSITDETVPENMRGTYKAFTQTDSDGMKHLKELADAGLNTVHLLPSFDIATIQEDRAQQVNPTIPDAGPASEEQQAAVTAVADQDGFNWGYDPYHFSTPEGSYATEGNQEGGARTYEYREMVGALHNAGVQVVLDQVFNHTNGSGQTDTSVLDKVVPGYYQRLSASGAVETSTCCQNVATEHAVAEKLMVDSILTWVKDYRVDGFRFDLMGHHSVDNMKAIRAALDELTFEEDGVDGSKIYLYGEGWNFGEVADNAQFTQATQGQLDGTGIGAFNDRLRDAAHGGGPFDADHRVNQGYGTGLYTDPNGLSTDSAATQLATLKHDEDLIKLGMAGNLKDFSFTTADGTVKKGSELDYNGAPAGYASQPQENVNYVDAHDNETLYDLSIMKLPVDTSMDDRVRMNTISLATVTLGQSPSFWHAGTEILRSKSLDRDSYNSGDWFNQVDWSMQENTFGSGLPVASKNEEKWAVMTPLLENAALKPDTAAMQAAYDQALDLLRIRKSTPLITLGTADLIKERVTFPGSGTASVPGLILMQIDDQTGAFAADIDANLDGVLIAMNATPEAITTTIPELAGREFVLNDIQANGSDEVVKQTVFVSADGTLTIPARTASVLVEKAAAATPTATVTVTVTAPAPTATVTATATQQVPVPGPTVTVTKTVTPAPTAAVPAPKAPYEVPGFHVINGRQWYTTCEPYSQTVRCRTDIWASQVTLVGGKYVTTTGWVFNNYTYLPLMTRAQWSGNHLGYTNEWVSGGRQWRTECDTAATGANACRSFILTSVIQPTKTATGYSYSVVQKWVVNNIVKFKVA